MLPGKEFYKKDREVVLFFSKISAKINFMLKKIMVFLKRTSTLGKFNHA